ncbi:hypothetical protein BDV95DRAFT_263832 [Massariosphaeria phaeospora]|uniref:Uncharacterized protein n=1 Tax=Massariosphaeria phaeospora TaxID=100035 RepID=A0A7C8LZY0_9PLEO|nr:hypothetical protein BDV95DRAFT_263832 [Massariosphaeria phaeospora]
MLEINACDSPGHPTQLKSNSPSQLVKSQTSPTLGPRNGACVLVVARDRKVEAKFKSIFSATSTTCLICLFSLASFVQSLLPRADSTKGCQNTTDQEDIHQPLLATRSPGTPHYPLKMAPAPHRLQLWCDMRMQKRETAAVDADKLRYGVGRRRTRG